MTGFLIGFGVGFVVGMAAMFLYGLTSFQGSRR